MNRVSRREFLLGSAALSAVGGMSLSWPSFGSNRPALPIPPELKADAKGNISLRAQAATRQFPARS